MAKKVLVLNSLASGGRISMSINIPLLSAMKMEVYPIPTALLSVHMAYEKPYKKELSESIAPIIKHFHSLGISFDGIYCGFLANKEQFDIVLDTIDLVRKKDSIILVDPCIADSGKLYKGFDDDTIVKVKKLCATANIITPNVTEACLLSGTNYTDFKADKDYIKNLADKIRAEDKTNIVITGVKVSGDTIAAAECSSQGVKLFNAKYTKQSFFGCGDMFASLLLGSLLNGKDISTAISFAHNFTTEVVCGSVGQAKTKFPDLKFEKYLSMLSEISLP